MTRKSRDRNIIIALVCAFFVELTLLLLHTGVIHFSSDQSLEGVKAGQILSQHNHLRRRSVNSLLWESTYSEEPLFYHDSILTLKDSTATLELNGTTDITLSENTLITIDPPENGREGEIRLTFTRGNFQSRNPYQRAAVHGESWAMDIKPGTDLEVRAVGEAGTDNIEIRLKKGEAAVQSSGEVKNLNADEILRLTPQGPQRFSLVDDLKFLNPPARRVYLHGDSIPVPLTWQGHADRLVVQKLGEPENEIPITSEQDAYLAALSHGDYRIYLRRGHESSSAIDLQVWSAPLIHLLQPLPRNRELLNEPITFLWQRHPQIPKYRMNFEGHKTKLSETLDENTVTKTFSSEDDATWFVEGVDSEGYIVPPLYRYPIYLREKPFEAPKIKAPRLRAPATKKEGVRGAWLWSLLLPSAEAEEIPRYEAEFSWEPVGGADQYVIEISESADFRNPVVNEVLKKRTQFIWRSFEFKKYHWRVAAGSARGRLGVFSEPMPIDFSPLKKGPRAVLDGVVIRELPSEVKTSDTKVAADPESAPDAVEPKPAPSPPPDLKRIVFWRPQLSYMNIPGDDLSATLSGASPLVLDLEWPWFDKNESLWLLRASFADRAFEPTDKDRYPFQSDLHWFEGQVELHRFRSSMGFGGSLRKILNPAREDYESLRADTQLWFGPDVLRVTKLSRGELRLKFELLFTNGGQALAATPEWRFHIGERMQTAVGVESLLILKAPDTGYAVHGYFSLGFPF